MFFFQDSRNLKDPDPPSCQVASHVPAVQSIRQRVARAPIFENSPRRAISVSPLSDTSSGYLEAVASDSESALGSAKVPTQRRPIDLKGFFFLWQESKCVAETKQREAAGQKRSPQRSS